MQSPKKQTQKGKAPPPKSLTSSKPTKKALQEELKEKHYTIKFLCKRTASLLWQRNEYFSALMDLMQREDVYKKIISHFTRGEEWKPENKEILESVRVPFHLN